MFERTIRALAVLAAAERERDEAVKQEFPYGMSVSWEHGDHVRRGTVISTCWGDVFVRLRTGNIRRLSVGELYEVHRELVDARR